MKTKSTKKTNQANGIPVHCAHARLADVMTLVANPRNPNKHGDTQVAMLAKIIRHQGWRSPITVSKRSGFIVSGHGRLQAAKLLKVDQVPVDEQDFATEADEWAHLIADNKIAELADTDELALSEIFQEMKLLPDFDSELFGMDNEQLEMLIADAIPKDAIDGSLLKLLSVSIKDPDVKVKAGQIWSAGRHIVACLDVFTEWPQWIKLLSPETLFLPYAGPFILLTNRAKEKRYVIVNPDPYICGHILQKWTEAGGEKPSHD